MVGFIAVIEKVETLRAMCVQNIDSQEIRDISIDVPAAPLDELHFRKAVAWCYALFQETGPFIGFSGKLLRTRASNAHERFGQVKRFIECARAVHAHNLLRESRSDMDKERFYQAWLNKNCGDPTCWELCNEALMNQIIQVMSEIEFEWKKMSEDEVDREELWRDYQMEKETSWEPHEFDRLVDKAAQEADVDGLDSSRFRKEGDRFNRWRKLVSCFRSRADAEEAIERAIRQELLNLFGQNSLEKTNTKN